MNKIYNYIFLVLCGLAISACVLVEESEIDEPEATELVPLSFTASTESATFTKVTMTGSVGEGTHKLLWGPGDQIGIIPLVESGYCDTKYDFWNTLSETSQTAFFEGQAANAESYIAVYPHRLTNVYDDMFQPLLPYVHSETSQIDIPIQLPESSLMGDSEGDLLYDFPMVAKFEAGSDISFHNLFGIFALSLTGTETISRITFVAEGDRKVSGVFSLSWLDDQWTLTPTSNSRNNLSIYAYVTLKEDEPTVFYFRLPPQIYDSFNILIATSEGTKMIKHADKPLEIKRSVLTPSGTLKFVETYPIDLSELGTANCYMVHEAGVYSFDASVIGNGNDGIISDADYHVSTAEIEPRDAYINWNEGPAEVISDVSYDPETKRVSFFVSGVEGNATIYANNSEYNEPWNWHIWVTDKPIEETYTNSVGTFVIQDRNLGATRADRGQEEQWKESIGLRYQWGRVSPLFKDLIYPYWYDYFQSINESLEAPDCTTIGQTWLSPMNTKLWSASQKTIYDPCPLGYRVANNDAFADFKTAGTMDMGWNVDYSSGVTAWYPVIPNLIFEETYVEEVTNEGYIWTADECSLQYGHTLHYSSSGFDLTMNRNVSDLFPVRCMKDEDYFTLDVPVLGSVEVKEKTSESAVVSYSIKREGTAEVTESGVIYGTVSGSLSENGTKVPVTGDLYQVELSGLTEGTKYYAMAYATNAYGTSYSKEISFRTRYANGVDLSENGTSNCYIISEPRIYIFNASLKGNSNEPVGNIVDFEVLWETNGITPAEAGTIITDVQLSGDYVMFESTGVEGNALIAVKDVSDNILWSWHIWATDEPVEHHYVGSSEDFYVLDRNVGAVRADRGDGEEWKESVGTQYQRGRKDPFVKGLYTVASSPYSTVEQSVANPTEFSSKSSNSWLEPKDYTLWSATEKTIYDPCPLGYRVATRSVFSCLTSNEAPGNGVYYYYDGENTAWYPGTPHNDCYGSYRNETGSYAYMWVSNATSTSSYEVDAIYFSTNSSGYVSSSSRSNGDSYPVRCMKE